MSLEPDAYAPDHASPERRCARWPWRHEVHPAPPWVSCSPQRDPEQGDKPRPDRNSGIPPNDF